MRSRLVAILLAGLAAAFLAMPVLAADLPAKEQLAQKIQILKREIVNLRMVLADLRSSLPIGAKSYLAVDLETGKVLAQKNPDQKLVLASVTKLMSAAVAVENIDQKKIVAITKEMLAPEGSSPVVYEGAKISVGDLLRAMMTQSVNDAAQALAITFGQEKFLALMNQKAKELEMKNTVFADAHGLSLKNRSTAGDLYKLLAYTQKEHPEILAMTRQNDFWLNDKDGQPMKFLNMNYLYPLANFLGGKTGYLPQSKQNLAAVFEKNKKPVAVIVLNSANAQADAFRVLEKIKN